MDAGGITVVVPVWNRRELIEPLFRTLRAQTAAPAAVIVVDNGSTDGAGDAAAAAGAGVLRLEHNAGFAAAVNCGIRACSTEWIAVLNNDVVLAPDYLERLRDAARDGAWFATGKIFDAGGGGTLDGTFDILSRGGTAWRAGNGQPDGPEWSAPRAIWSAPWTAVLFRAALFDRAGWLDESFESYLEDVEFGVRCALAGLNGVYVPGAVAWHSGSATLGRWHPDTVRRISRNQLLLVARHFPRLFAWPVLVAQLLWGLVALRHGAGVAWLRGKTEALQKCRSVRSTYRPGSEKVLIAWLRENDRLLAAAPSRYWRVYSLLTHGEAK
jgi:GT2 family glycosyltransferase